MRQIYSRAQQKLDIPKVHYSVLLGFIEVLDDLGGKSDVAGIASKQGLELDHLLPILESGEMLGFIPVRGCINY